MATHKSAEKRARQTIRKNAVNSARRGRVRTAEKKLIKALTSLDIKAVPQLLKDYTSEATRAVSKGVFKKQTMSRKVGRLAVKAHKVASGTDAVASSAVVAKAKAPKKAAKASSKTAPKA